MSNRTLLIRSAEKLMPNVNWDLGLPLTRKYLFTSQHSIYVLPHVPSAPAYQTTMNDIEAMKLRAKYTHFRILVIGRANAGKTTLLKRVCNTDEDPCIYNENNENQLVPTDERGIHDIEKQFMFKSNPRFIFHDSPGFEAGNEQELKDVLAFIEKRSKSNEPKEQLHAIWFDLIIQVYSSYGD
ncbi:hypothetical protein HYPSUDRAFT_189789 [Hypholoma sublateritium FD-334 SS-4]|uniref:G domain-containing protein n=1 Tax=Hypholoma sublateritium (strain FD-334 SS-4) TaxID=945553 RepID=A0A0D2NSE3_HYPSF|nr:hypothetical protein HYPSUDRAFT_189789 [Hypholoma sublateritium FD-334 SS-4]